MLKQVEIFTDGSCLGNPGPGGYGAILRYRGREKTFSAGYTRTTNNRMELTGVITALEALNEPCVVELYSDSKYVIDALEKGMSARVSPSGSITGKNVAGKPQTKNQ